MAVALFGSVVVLGTMALLALQMFIRFKESERKQVDAVKLGALLDEKLKSMEELKTRMEHLLIKNGLVRPNGG